MYSHYVCVCCAFFGKGRRKNPDIHLRMYVGVSVRLMSLVFIGPASQVVVDNYHMPCKAAVSIFLILLLLINSSEYAENSNNNNNNNNSV